MAVLISMTLAGSVDTCRTRLPTPVSELHLPRAHTSVTQQNAVRAELVTFPVLLLLSVLVAELSGARLCWED